MEEVIVRAMQLNSETLILIKNSPSQLRNIARTDLNVIDRSQLILDIFAQRAKPEGNAGRNRTTGIENLESKSCPLQCHD